MSDDEREQWAITDRGMWLEMRRHDLTASAIGAIFGVHPYVSAEQLAARMRGTSDAGTSMPPDNPSMRRGRILEAGVAVAVAEERPQWKLEKALAYHRLPGHRLGATPDYFIRSTDPAEPGLGILEIKTVNPQQWDRWQANPPLAYKLQVLVQMMCTGADYGWIASMVTSPSLPVFYTPVPRHAAAEPGLGILEIKTVNPQKWDEWHAAPPLAYKLQVLVQMMCTGADYGWIASMVTSPSLPVFYTPVPRHAAAEERIKRAAAAWWAEFDSGALAAPADATGLAAELDDGSSVDLTKNNRDLAALLDEREMLKQSLSVEEKRVGEIDAILKAALGRARTGWLPGWAVTWATQHRRETVIPARDIRVLRVRRIAESEAADE